MNEELRNMNVTGVDHTRQFERHVLSEVEVSREMFTKDKNSFINGIREILGKGTFLLIILTCLSLADLHAQSKRVNFSGLGRSVMAHDALGGNLKDTDTTSLDKSFNGLTLLDLGFNISPNNSTKIEAEMRLVNTFGGFWGAGVSVDIRKLLVQGIIKEKLKYSVGDFNFRLTPYTFGPHNEELIANEPTVFQDIKDILYYENLIFDSAWRQQGLMLDFGLQSTGFFESMDFKTFITRTRGASIASFPERFFSGLSWRMHQSKYFDFGVDVVDLFDLAETSQNQERLNNLVVAGNTTVKFEIDSGTVIGLKGEGGMSTVNYANLEVVPDDLSDYFMDFDVFAETKFGLKASVGYKNVGPDYFSAGAQTKVMNWGANPAFFPEVTNDVVPRETVLMDIYYDDQLYNRQIQQDLGPYLPKYGNAEPYGAATPNRSGVKVNLSYMPNKGYLNVFARTAFLSEIIGTGSTEKKKFMVISGGVDFHLNKLIGFDRTILLNTGIKYEKTSRDGLNVSMVDLSSLLLDVGLDVEVAKKLDVLWGLKYFTASGNDFINVRDNFNKVVSFTQYTADETDMLMATGLKYRFNENVYITVQYIGERWTNNLNDAGSFNINRALVLFNAKF